MTAVASFWRGRRVAITGATGFVGYHLSLALLRRGATVSALVRNLDKARRLSDNGVRCVNVALHDQPALTEACTGCEFVFHLAGAVDFAEDWQRFYSVNVEGTRCVLAAARAAGVRRLVHTSSIVAVGALPQPKILDERAVWNLGYLKVPYITTKRRAEEAVLAASESPPEVVVVNPASVIGPDDFFSSEFGTLCRRFWSGQIPLYFSGGHNCVDVRDVAEGHLLAAERGRAGERYLLTGTNRTYGEFFNDLTRSAGRSIARLRLPTGLAVLAAEITKHFQPQDERPALNPNLARMQGLYFFFDCAKARSELGYQPRPYRQTLADTHAFWATALGPV